MNAAEAVVELPESSSEPQAHPRGVRALDWEGMVAALDRAAQAIESGETPEPIEAARPPFSELCRAFNRVARSLDTRQQVLLALEELAKEQAAEVAQQNEQLRRNQALLEKQNRELQAKNAELWRANKMKSEFLATMSHELRTPLTAVIGFSDLLLEGVCGPLNAEQHEFIGDIGRSGRHLLDIINDLLDMAKIDAGRMEFARVKCDLHEVVHQAEEIARVMAMRKRQRLSLVAEGEVTCVGDPQRIRQIALNLMSNAVKFTPEGGAIHCAVRVREGAAEFVVRDEGIGIDPAHHGLIFEAFRQIDQSVTRGYQGTGLGLTLVRKFCEAMGGSVRVESKLGEGATFIVRLPGTTGGST